VCQTDGRTDRPTDGRNCDSMLAIAYMLSRAKIDSLSSLAGPVLCYPHFTHPRRYTTILPASTYSAMYLSRILHVYATVCVHHVDCTVALIGLRPARVSCVACCLHSCPAMHITYCQPRDSNNNSTKFTSRHSTHALFSLSKVMFVILRTHLTANWQPSR